MRRKTVYAKWRGRLVRGALAGGAPAPLRCNCFCVFALILSYLNQFVKLSAGGAFARFVPLIKGMPRQCDEGRNRVGAIPRVAGPARWDAGGTEYGPVGSASTESKLNLKRPEGLTQRIATNLWESTQAFL